MYHCRNILFFIETSSTTGTCTCAIRLELNESHSVFLISGFYTFKFLLYALVSFHQWTHFILLDMNEKKRKKTKRKA